jgi:cell division septation protein DedD
VRPDGTLISSGFEANTAATPTPTPVPTPTHAATLDAEDATPAPALPTKLSPPKSAARVVSKSDTTAPADQGAGPVPVKPKKPRPTPTPTPVVADAEPKSDNPKFDNPKSDNLKSDNLKSDDAKAAETKTADAKADDAGGGYSVQLAAPNNRADADELVGKAKARYAEAIGGASVGVRKADRHGEAIYRVRVLGLSRAQASAMCAKIKSSGGDCFAAKN